MCSVIASSFDSLSLFCTGKNDALSGEVFQRFCSSLERALRASADVDVTRSDSLFVVRKSASPRGFDLLTHREGRGIGRRLTTGVDPCSRKAHALQDNCVHKSSVNYGDLRSHFQDRASASIHVCPAVRGHLPGSLRCRYCPDSGDFRDYGPLLGCSTPVETVSAVRSSNLAVH